MTTALPTAGLVAPDNTRPDLCRTHEWFRLPPPLPVGCVLFGPRVPVELEARSAPPHGRLRSSQATGTPGVPAKDLINVD